ncbi:ROK family protein [Nocardioides sp.]|uniref:ROK family protein n=1 Tax=Nocardioides sp. TaxID=35761 RepID=UPI003517E936
MAPAPGSSGTPAQPGAATPPGAPGLPGAPGAPGGAEVLRRRNTALVLQALRSGGPASRAELAGRTGLAKATVGVIAADLTAAGALRELSEPARPGERGRPGLRLTLEGGRPVGVGFEVNVEYVAAAVVDLAGVTRHAVTRAIASSDGGGALDTLEALRAVAAETAAWLRAADLALAGTTVALPGLVGDDDRSVRWTPNLRLGAPQAVAELVDAAFATPGRTRVSNDADCAAVAELRHGSGRGVVHLLYLTGTVGIGAGVIDDGRLVRGGRGFAGEVGHLPIGAPDAVCGCGRTGCWEASVGLHALLAATGLPERGTPVETAASVVAAAADSAPVRAAVTELGRRLGRGLAVVSGVLDPRAIVLGGYFVPLGGLVLQPAAAELTAALATSHLAVPELRLGRLGTEAAATGAAERSLEALLAGAADLP